MAGRPASSTAAAAEAPSGTCTLRPSTKTSTCAAPGARAYDVFTDCFRAGLLIRVTGDIIARSPPLIIEPDQIGRIAETVRGALERAG